MRSKLILGLAAVVLAFGIASTSAAPIDALRSAAEPSSMMPPQGGFASGLSALKSSNASNVKATPPAEISAFRSTSEGVARPKASHAWSDGLAALAALMPREVAVSKNTLQAMMPPPGMAVNANGFAAIKEVSALHGGPSPDVESLRSSARPGENLYSR